MPFLFLLYAALAFLGGALYAPANIDGLILPTAASPALAGGTALALDCYERLADEYRRHRLRMADGPNYRHRAK
jgi:hypothetical protein